MSQENSMSNPYSDRSQQLQPQQQSYSHDNQNDQFVDRDVPLQQDKDFFQIYGMFFCGTCKNMIQPLSTKGQLLEFACKRCGPMVVNFKHRQQRKCMLYSKALQQSSRRTLADPKFIFDPSMPRVSIQCPDCGYPQAVYVVTPDQGQRKIVVKLICSRGAQFSLVQCGNIWDLEQDAQVEMNSIRQIGTQKSIQQAD